MRDVGRMVLVLGVIGAISAGLLAGVRARLEPRIERQQELRVKGPALARLLGQSAAASLADRLVVETDAGAYPVYYRRAAGEVVALAIEATGRGGYRGDILMMVGIDPRDDRIIGTEVIAHLETSGVGSAVESASFRDQWRGLSAAAPIALRTEGGEVDAISGATISSRAMIEGTNQAIRLLREREGEILAQIAARPADGGSGT